DLPPLIDQFEASGDLNESFAAELRERLNVIRSLVNRGDEQQSVEYLEDFARHIQDPSVREQGLISEKAVKKLSEQIKETIGSPLNMDLNIRGLTFPPGSNVQANVVLEKTDESNLKDVTLMLRWPEEFDEKPETKTIDFG